MDAEMSERLLDHLRALARDLELDDSNDFGLFMACRYGDRFPLTAGGDWDMARYCCGEDNAECRTELASLPSLNEIFLVDNDLDDLKSVAYKLLAWIEKFEAGG